MFSRRWRCLRADAALPAEGEACRRPRSLHARARRHHAGGMRLSRQNRGKPQAESESKPGARRGMKLIEFEDGAFQVEASVVAEGLGIALPLLRRQMQAGRITGVAE